MAEDKTKVPMHLNKALRAQSENTDWKPATISQALERVAEFPSLTRIKNELGEGQQRVIITTEVAKMIVGLPHEFTKEAIDRLVDYIAANHGNLKRQEFYLIGLRLLSKKIFGKLYINDIITEIEMYWDERCELAAEQQQNNKVTPQIAHAEILEQYQKLKDEATIKPTEEERRDTIKATNNAKVTELEKIYKQKLKKR